MSTALYCFSLCSNLCHQGSRHFLSHWSNSDRVMYHYGAPHSLSIIHPSLVPSLLSLPSPSPARWFAFVCICLYRPLSSLHFPVLFTAIHWFKNLSKPLSSLHFYFPSEMKWNFELWKRSPLSSFTRLIPRHFSFDPFLSSYIQISVYSCS